MAARYFSVWLGFLIACLNVQLVQPSGTLEIEFHKFRLTNQEDRCCSCWFYQEKCDIYFDVCLTKSQSPHCMFHPITKGVYEDKADIVFRGDRMSLPLPKKTFSIKVEISDEDFWIDQYVDTVQIFVDNLIPTQNGQRGNYSLHSLVGDNSILELKVRSYCDEGFYGERCRQKCEANAEGGHTCEDTVGGFPPCDDEEYFITLDGEVDERNLQDLRTGLVDILKEHGEVEGDIHVQVSTNVDEIDPGVNGTIVTFCMSQPDGPVKLEIIKEVFETQDDDTLNSYLPFDLFRKEEMGNKTHNNHDDDDDDNDRTWVSKHWYVILIILIVVIIVAVVSVVVFFIIKARRRLQSEEDFWRCHSGQTRRSHFDIGFINPFYGAKRRPSDAITHTAGNRPISCISDVTCRSNVSGNHYEDIENLPNPLH